MVRENSNITEKGFTLIELMVVVVILSIVTLGLVTFFTGGARSWISGQSQLKSQREARQAMEYMVREIRHGESVVTGNTHTVTLAVPQLDSDPAYQVTYSWSGTNWDPVNREVNSVISNVIDFTFEYYCDTDPVNPITSLPVSVSDNVNKIHIQLQIDTDKDSKPDIELNSDIDLRNYGL